MKRLFAFLFSFLLIVVACKTVPLTGRKGLKLMKSSEINSMSFQQYNELKSSSNLSTNREQVEMVKRVGQRIQMATTQYLTQKGHAELLEGYEWEFILIESDQVNAFCMPGGKVAFYTGILPYCENETGVAVVMGHEIAHAIAEHGNERMSQALVQQLGGIALAVSVSNESPENQALFMTAYGLGTQYGAMLPFSRLHESEADELGLYFMAMAGYDPQDAPKFWERMAQSGGGKPPEFMSTHPSDQRRIDDLNSHMPKALTFYKKSKP